MSPSPDVVVMFCQAFEAHLKKRRHLNTDQLLDLFARRGIAKDRRDKATLCSSPVELPEMRVEERIAPAERYLPPDMSLTAEVPEVIEYLQTFFKLHVRTVAPVIAVFAVEVASLRHMPLERKRMSKGKAQRPDRLKQGVPVRLMRLGSRTIPFPQTGHNVLHRTDGTLPALATSSGPKRSIFNTKDLHRAALALTFRPSVLSIQDHLLALLGRLFRRLLVSSPFHENVMI
jgi:hypothetical protein